MGSLHLGPSSFSENLEEVVQRPSGKEYHSAFSSDAWPSSSISPSNA